MMGFTGFLLGGICAFFYTAQCEMSVDVLLCYMLCPAVTPMDVLMLMT